MFGVLTLLPSYLVPPPAQIADFGYAVRVNRNTLRSQCGTPWYGAALVQHGLHPSLTLVLRVVLSHPSLHRGGLTPCFSPSP